MSTAGAVDLIRESLGIGPGGKRSDSLDYFREIALFILSIALGFAVEKYAGPAPDQFHDNANVILENTYLFGHYFPYSSDLGFKTEFHTFSGPITEEAATLQTNLLFGARESIEEYDKLLLLTYWPDEPRIQFRASEVFGKLQKPDIPLRMLSGPGPRFTHSEFLEINASRLVEQLPEAYRMGERKLPRDEFNRYLVATVLVVSIIGLIVLTAVFGIAGRFGIDSFFYIVSFGSLPLLLYADYRFENVISSSALSVPLIESMTWLVSGLVFGAAMHLTGLQQVGNYIIRRHIPFALAVFGFRQSNFAILMISIVFGAILNWLIYRRSEVRSPNA